MVMLMLDNNALCRCRTVGGPSTNKRCSFPFKQKFGNQTVIINICVRSWRVLRRLTTPRAP